jgi:hypothetical protein
MMYFILQSVSTLSVSPLSFYSFVLLFEGPTYFDYLTGSFSFLFFILFCFRNVFCLSLQVISVFIARFSSLHFASCYCRVSTPKVFLLRTYVTHLTCSLFERPCFLLSPNLHSNIRSTTTS